MTHSENKLVFFKSIKVTSDNKIAKLFYDNTAFFYGDLNYKNSNIPQLVFNTYKEILSDPHLKYFMYFNTLEDYRSDYTKNYVFCNAYSTCYETIFGEKYSANGALKAARYMPYEDIILPSIDYKIPWFSFPMAHEIIHRTYYKLYNKNDCLPLNSSDIAKQEKYLKAYELDFNDLKENFDSFKKSGRSSLTKEQIAKNNIFDMIDYYPDSRKASEIIAHCQQYRFLDKSINPCPEINRYVEESIIPDLIDFIEHHVLCEEIAEYDSTIKCAGTRMIDEEL